MLLEDEGWDSEKVRRFRFIYDEIAHENLLMSNRLNWFITSQAFLLTALSVAHRGGSELPTGKSDFLFPLVPIISIASCLLILIGIVAGTIALHRWRVMLRATLARTDYLPSLRLDQTIAVMGWSGPILLPIIFLIAWVYLLINGLLVG